MTYEGQVTVRVVTSVAEAIVYVTQSRSAAEGTKLLSLVLHRTRELIPYRYVYDFAGNRTAETIGTATTTSTPNTVNEITGQSGGVNRTLTYDLNGNITSDGGTRTFEWDAANRLIAVNYTGQTTRSEFSYDGLGRVAKIVEKTGATINSTRKFVWCGQEKCEFRDANDAVTLRVYSQGQHNGTTAYFFTRDHLGSVREMFTGSGTVVSQYEYDPYGRSATITGTTTTDFNFTGLYRHTKSNLDLAGHRAYDPDLGRWLNRDPIGEEGGINLYGYAGNKPIANRDPSGLLWGMDWLDNPTFDAPLQNVSNFAAGFGDALSFNLTQLAREGLGFDDVVDKCSGSYNGGWWSGLAYSVALGGTGSLNGGARSVFYSGRGALEAAQLGKGGGIILSETLGGRALTAVNAPQWAWKGASGIFAANAKGEVQVFLRSPVNRAGIWTTIEKPTLDWFANTVVKFR